MTKTSIVSIAATLVVAGASGFAAADEPGAAAALDSRRAPQFEVSLKAGGHFPQLTNELGTNFDALLKFGVGVALERRLQVFAELGYTQPTHAVSVASDSRLAAMGAPYKSDMTVRDLNTSVGLNYYFLPMDSHWLPYAGAGIRFHFLKSEVTGASSMVAFGNNDETSTQVGGQGFGGVALHLGPGIAIGELRFSYAPVAQKVTGEANVGSLSALLGYGLLF